MWMSRQDADQTFIRTPDPTNITGSAALVLNAKIRGKICTKSAKFLCTVFCFIFSSYSCVAHSINYLLSILHPISYSLNSNFLTTCYFFLHQNVSKSCKFISRFRGNCTTNKDHNCGKLNCRSMRGLDFSCVSDLFFRIQIFIRYLKNCGSSQICTKPRS